MRRTMRMSRTPLATPMTMVNCFSSKGRMPPTLPGESKVRVTSISLTPPLLIATQEYVPRSLEVTPVIVRLWLSSIPPWKKGFVL